MTKNTYDDADIVSRSLVLYADGLKAAAYRVRDPITHALSPPLLHMTWDNTVIATLTQAAVEFLEQHLEQIESFQATAQPGAVMCEEVSHERLHFAALRITNSKGEGAIRVVVYEQGLVVGVMGYQDIKLAVTLFKQAHAPPGDGPFDPPEQTESM